VQSKKGHPYSSLYSCYRLSIYPGLRQTKPNKSTDAGGRPTADVLVKFLGVCVMKRQHTLKKLAELKKKP